MTNKDDADGAEQRKFVMYKINTYKQNSPTTTVQKGSGIRSFLCSSLYKYIDIFVFFQKISLGQNWTDFEWSDL